MRPNTEYTDLTPEPIIRAASIQEQRLGRIGSVAHCLYFPRCRPPRQAHGCIIRFRRSKDSKAENLRSDSTIRTIARIRPTMLRGVHRTEAGFGFAERPTRTVVGQHLPARPHPESGTRLVATCRFPCPVAHSNKHSRVTVRRSEMCEKIIPSGPFGRSSPFPRRR